MSKSRSKSLVRIKLDKNVLGKYGYHVKNTKLKERRKALSKAIKYLDPLSVSRRLNALYVLNKNTNPELAMRFRRDSKWIKKTDKYLSRSKSRKLKKNSKSKSKKSRKLKKNSKSRKLRKLRKNSKSRK